MACEVLHNMLKEIARLDNKSADHKGWMVQENVVLQIRKASGTHPASDMLKQIEKQPNSKLFMSS